MPDVAGPVLFARYAYPPNALGYCGPGDAEALLEYADASANDRGLVELARQFSGAWPYLALIAGAAGRDDPLDREVVEAYWLGGPLLESLPPRLLIADLENRLRPQLGGRFTNVAQLVAAGGRAHHNFHVFAVYPWVGMLRAGFAEEPLHVLQSCRVRWGRVGAVRGDRVELWSRPLEWDGHRLTLGPARPEIVQASHRGYGLAPRVVPGDCVSAHWGWVCDVLDGSQLARLAHYTHTQLRLVNETLDRPATAALLG